MDAQRRLGACQPGVPLVLVSGGFHPSPVPEPWVDEVDKGELGDADVDAVAEAFLVADVVAVAEACLDGDVVDEEAGAWVVEEGGRRGGHLS